MSLKLEKNQSPILVKFLMIHNNTPKKNHQNWWYFLVHKMSLNLEQNYSQNKVKILVIQRIFLQKCHQNWWKSDGITRICANFVENQDGIIYVQKSRREQHIPKEADSDRLCTLNMRLLRNIFIECTILF